MKLTVLALDYDGTIAVQGVLDQAVRAAIQGLRRQGIVVVLVTGRILRDLQRSAGDLHFVDAIVAENGGVLAHPEAGSTTVLGQPPPAAFLQELIRQGIATGIGQCLVEADAMDAAAIIASIRQLGLPLSVAFNRGRLMVLPQAISKASGLHAALRLLGRSAHNALGIGDGENDHALLEACELGVAVAWGHPALIAAADAVVPGQGPPAMATYLRGLGGELRLPEGRLDRRRLALGVRANGTPVTIAMRSGPVLIVGDSGTGKSWVAGLLCEQLILAGYALCVLDPEGDYRSLARLPGVLHLGGAGQPPRLAEVLAALRHPELSAVVDLSQVEPATKRAYVAALVPQLAALRAHSGLPHHLVLDEAHQFLREGVDDRLLKTELDASILVTYRAGELAPAVRARSRVVIATRVARPDELGRLSDPAGQGRWEPGLRTLAVGEAALLPPPGAADPALDRFQLAPRQTDHVRHRVKYLDLPVAAAKAFVFTDGGRPIGPRAATLRELAGTVHEVADRVLRGHLERGDLSRWIGSVYTDPVLAADVATLEHLSPQEALSDVRAAIPRLIKERYGPIDDWV